MADWFEENTTPARADSSKPPGVPMTSAQRVLGLGPSAAQAAPAPDLQRAALEASLTPENPRAAERQANYPSVGEAATIAIPSLAAGLASAAVPPAAPIAWLMRMLAAGGASGVTDLGVQAARGKELDVPGAVLRGATDMGGQGVGELLGVGIPAAGRQLVKSGLNVGKPQAAYAVEMGSQLAGKPVRYADVDLADQAIKEGVAPGGKLGQPRMQELKAEPMRRRKAILDRETKAGKTATRMDFTNEISALKKRLARGPNGTKNAERIDALLEDFIDQGRTKPGKPLKGNPMKKMSPNEWEKMKEEWQAWAKTAYRKDSGELGAINDEFSKAIAKAVQDRIEALTPPAVPGGVGEIAAANRRYRELLPLDEAVNNAELPSKGIASFKDMNPLRVLSPNVRGRAGLMLSNPALARGAREAPRAAGASAYALMEMLRAAQAEEEQGVTPE